MPRETEYVKAHELSDGSLPGMPPADELPNGRGCIVKILNDSGVLTIETEHWVGQKGQNAPIERYVR